MDSFADMGARAGAPRPFGQFGERRHPIRGHSELPESAQSDRTFTFCQHSRYGNRCVQWSVGVNVKMAGLEIKKFGWFRRQPLWKENQAWRERRAAMREDFAATNAIASNSLATAQTNLIGGLASLAVQASIARAQSQTTAKQGQINKLV
jgi:hypothetical protein